MTATTACGALAAERGTFVEAELQRLLLGDLPPEQVGRLRELLESPLFDAREGLTDAEVADLAYRRAHFIVRSLRLSPLGLAQDPNPLFALHEWIPLVDGVATTVLSIHYCLTAGSIVALGENRPELAPFLEELERMDACGVFLATELGYGNNVASLETEAVYDPATREFLLKSPRPQAYKFMPNTGTAVPKLAVVMARLVSQGKDRGVFPFVVRIRDQDGAVCEGIRIARLSEKPGNSLDNAVTRFDGVRVPKAQLLSGGESVLHDDGSFETSVPNRHKRFLNAMDRVQTGRVCFTSTAIAFLRAATWIAVRYTGQRRTFAPGGRDVPLLAYHNVQKDVFGALASAYALTFAIRSVQSQFRARSAETEKDCFRVVATLKAVASSAVGEELAVLRERCGGVGLLASNRIVQYWNQVQGIITAEGDNHLMLLKVGRQLLELPVVPPERPEPLDDFAALDSSRIVLLLRFRDVHLREELRRQLAASARSARDPFLAWNQNVNHAIALATAHGECLIAESFAYALRRTQSPALRASLSRLFALWALRIIERQGAFFLAECCIAAGAFKELSAERDRLCAGIAPDSAALIAGFGLDNAVLRAPIAENDYVKAYDPWDETGSGNLRESGSYRVRGERLDDRARPPGSRR